MQTAVPFSESFPAETPLELAESLSKSSSAAGILAAGHSLSNSIGGAASESPLLHDGDVTVPACPGEKQAPQVIIIGDSLDDKSLLSSIEEVDYPGKSQVRRGDTFPVDRRHTPRPQDSGSYVDTLDERLDEVFFALEKGAEVTGHVLAERSMAVLGGSQLAGSGCLDRKAARTPTAAVSRDQLQMSDRLHRHPRSGSRSVANYAHQDDSQVVYYRH
uniref:Uncharacterized protein TCIL3000_4_1090 n=1 Tax=Trypanosoma congolense (strain IL3000) TaxID=1068625 RepID=G0UKX0_TRYCI|nr:unnamed protein product [Trypanosoma congolense IL3000]